MKFLKNNLANFITISRVVMSISLLQLKLDSFDFIMIYTICGITDIVDGTIARLLKITSHFGSVLDSISDLIFYMVLLLKLWPILQTVIPVYLWVWFYLILGLRAFLYIYVGYNHKNFLSNHTIWNKLTGFSVFMYPYVLFFYEKYSFLHLLAIFIIATIAVVVEMKLVERSEKQ